MTGGTRARCGVAFTPGTFSPSFPGSGTPSDRSFELFPPSHPNPIANTAVRCPVGGAARHGNPPLPSALSHGCYTLAIDPSAVLSVVCTCGAQHSSRSGSSIPDIYGSRRLPRVYTMHFRVYTIHFRVYTMHLSMYTRCIFVYARCILCVYIAYAILVCAYTSRLTRAYTPRVYIAGAPRRAI